MISRIKKLLGKEDHLKKADLDKLMKLSPGERGPFLISILYESAFQNAAKFVHDELRRPESPFLQLQRDLFFNEILIMNFWMMEKVYLKYLGEIAEKMHSHYFGALSDIEKRTAALPGKMKTFSLCWDEFTGHHDEFGLKVGETLFGPDSEFPVKQVSFWIISYVDDSIKTFRKIRKQCLETGLIHKGE
jgi:hypothetical protein